MKVSAPLVFAEGKEYNKRRSLRECVKSLLLNGHSSGTDGDGAGGGSAKAPQSTLERINQFATLQSDRHAKCRKFQRKTTLCRKRIRVSSLRVSSMAIPTASRETQREVFFLFRLPSGRM